MIKRILAPTDFSEVAATGVAYAYQLASDLEAELIVITVIAPDESNYVSSGELQERKRQLDEFIAENFGGAGSNVIVRKLVESGVPAATIAYWARDQKPDLIVMSSHGRTGLKRALMGSVAEEVLRNSPCPVLVVPMERQD
jgi:nucleotide-binding universal stress UspA family protein